MVAISDAKHFDRCSVKPTSDQKMSESVFFMGTGEELMGKRSISMRNIEFGLRKIINFAGRILYSAFTFRGREGRALLTLTLFLSAPVSFRGLMYAGGGEPGGFMQWGAGARSLGMGRAFLAVSDDASATYWNPAAMVQIDHKEL